MSNLQHILPQAGIAGNSPDGAPFSRKGFHKLALAHCRLSRAAKKAGMDPLHYFESLHPASEGKGANSPQVALYERRVEEFEKAVSATALAGSPIRFPSDMDAAALQAYKAFPSSKAYRNETHLMSGMPTESDDARFLSRAVSKFRIPKIIMAVFVPLLALATFLQLHFENNAAVLILWTASFLGASFGAGSRIFAGRGMAGLQGRYSKKILDAVAGALEGKRASGNHAIADAKPPHVP
ncbi:MAG: hypothetical protein WC861_03380 [Candidatus Micrarchaeia archaeon]|jgi:hypothetical protein